MKQWRMILLLSLCFLFNIGCLNSQSPSIQTEEVTAFVVSADIGTAVQSASIPPSLTPTSTYTIPTATATATDLPNSTRVSVTLQASEILPPLQPYSYATDNASAVQETEALAEWLIAAWNNDLDTGKVRDMLVETHWITEGDFWGDDIDGDNSMEWLLTFYLYPPDYEFARSGDFWIIGNDGLEYRFFRQEDYFQITDRLIPFSPNHAPTMISISRLTDDSLSDVVLNVGSCGAHTCWDDYFVLSGHFGKIEHIVEYPATRHEWGKTILHYQRGLAQMSESALPITMSFSSHAVIDFNGDGRNELILVGGQQGSAGSGRQRTRTEIWGWTGTGIGLVDLKWHPTTLRIHLLWEANDYYDMLNYDQAVTLYEQLISDMNVEKEDIYNSYNPDNPQLIAQFSAFRLALIGYTLGDPMVLDEWATWLNENFPDSTITQAVITLQAGWLENIDTKTVCDEITLQLEQIENVYLAFPYEYGHGNPVVDFKDLCVSNDD
jgi:hypothetical protein